jgi:hypothetical protein
MKNVGNNVLRLSSPGANLFPTACANEVRVLCTKNSALIKPESKNSLLGIYINGFERHNYLSFVGWVLKLLTLRQGLF